MKAIRSTRLRRWAGNIAIKVLFCGLLIVATRVAEAADSPNVVFILADDIGWRDTTPYGTAFHDTPNIARLAARGLRFTDAYAASPFCSPTRASTLTGLYPARMGITAPGGHMPKAVLEKGLARAAPGQRVVPARSVNRLMPAYVTLAERYRDAGYATAHFGKWHLGHSGPYEPRHHGFQVAWPDTPGLPAPVGGYLAPWKFISDATQSGQPGEHIEDRISDEAARFIVEHKDEPFFLNYWPFSVHAPWQAKPELVEKFKKRAKATASQRNPVYAAMVKTLDDAVGRLIEAVDAAGISDRTIIVFTSDNGGFASVSDPFDTDPPGYGDIPLTSNAPLRSGKGSIYEGGTRVPTIVVWPGKTQPGTVTGALLSSIDWYPTLLEMSGLKLRGGAVVDGVSQVPALIGQGSPRDTVICHFPHGDQSSSQRIPGYWPSTSLRRGDWKLIRFYAANDDQTDRLELYDLRTDEAEAQNLAGERPQLVSELSQRMTEFLRDTAAVIPIANPAYLGSPR